MARSPLDLPDQRQALEALAREANLQEEEVVKLYEASVAELAAKAKIDTFLHVFAMRDLQTKLKTLR